jgi:hypothetical protein
MELQTGAVYVRMDLMNNLYGVNLLYCVSAESRARRGKNVTETVFP